MKDLNNRPVLLTGTPGGIGPRLASRLHAEGVSLVLSGRNQAELERLATTLPPARFIVADLSREEEVERLAAAAGPIDIPIANAAVPASGELGTLSLGENDRAFDVDLRPGLVLPGFVVAR